MIRRHLALALLVAAFATPALAEEMTLEKVLEQHYDAIGGLEPWESWETVRMTGEMGMPGPSGPMKAPFTMTFANAEDGGASRLEFTLQGMTASMAYDGETAWAIQPWMGSTVPQALPEQQREQMAEQSDFSGPLIHPEKKGVELEYQGVEEVEGTPAHKIKILRSNGDVRVMYLDSDHFLPIKAEGKAWVQGQQLDFESTFGDYKEVDGRVIAHSLETRPKGSAPGSGQTISIENVTFGVDLPDGYFAIPAAPAAPEPAPADDE